ncbi:MAG: transposase [Flavobacteriales bacterium Tduv]
MIVEASITVSPLAIKGDLTSVVEDRNEEVQKQISQRKTRVKKETQSGVDTQEKWLKKSGKLYYGYKKHIWVDKNGIILAVHNVAANEHDSRGLKPLIGKLRYNPIEVYAEKGYQVVAKCLTFIVEASNTVYRKKSIGSVL